MKKPLLVVVVAAAVAGIATAYVGRESRIEAQASYATLTVERGALSSVVNASGTLNPVKTVQVGSQVSGRVVTLRADFNSAVGAGEEIARIDDELFQARVAQAAAELETAQAEVRMRLAAVASARADLENAGAAVRSADALVVEAAAAAADARRELERSRELFERRMVPRAELDARIASHEQVAARLESARARGAQGGSERRAREAGIQMAEAEVATARARVSRSRALLLQAEVDLARAVIRSPVDGIVVERNVDVGQTVAASLQAPILFLIAEDLERMQVEVAVDEADVGRVQTGQAVRFTVDSFPGREFAGEVIQVRLAPQTIQNVVTYTVVASADNRDRLLLPGMTANAEVVVRSVDDALKIPNAALRYRPAGSSAPDDASPRRGAAEGRERAERRIAALTERLELNAAQQAQLREIMRAARATVLGEVRAGGDREAARAKAREQVAASIPAILSGTQLERYRRLVAARQADPVSSARVWTLAPDGTPAPVDVRIGMSDGNFTEVVGGGLEAGTALLTGENPVARDVASPGVVGRLLARFR